MNDSFLIHCENILKNKEALMAKAAVKTTKATKVSANSSGLTDTQKKIVEITDGLQDLLLYKNQKYGDSALHPQHIFYKGDNINSILIRLDDKISRVINSTEPLPRDNDTLDIAGYLVLLECAKGVTAEDISKFKD